MPSIPPYILEDRTGINSASDFDDLYDRIFFRIARQPQRTTSTMIYSMNIRGSRHRDSLPFNQHPIAVLDFAPDQSLGTVSFLQPRPKITISMNRYLRKTSLFGGYATSFTITWHRLTMNLLRSLLRKFTASDGKEYKWGHRVIEGQEWSVSGCRILTDPEATLIHCTCVQQVYHSG